MITVLLVEGVGAICIALGLWMLIGPRHRNGTQEMTQRERQQRLHYASTELDGYVRQLMDMTGLPPPTPENLRTLLIDVVGFTSYAIKVINDDLTHDH
jgi:hypothetical protein